MKKSQRVSRFLQVVVDKTMELLTLDPKFPREKSWLRTTLSHTAVTLCHALHREVVMIEMIHIRRERLNHLTIADDLILDTEVDQDLET